jgi:hypothetical protein
LVRRKVCATEEHIRKQAKAAFHVLLESMVTRYVRNTLESKRYMRYVRDK